MSIRQFPKGGGGAAAPHLEVPLDRENLEREARFKREFLKFGEEDIERLRELNDLSDEGVSSIVEGLYEHFFSFEESRKFFSDPELLGRVKGLQKEYFRRLTRGEYGPDYIEDRRRIGAAHERVNLPPDLYICAYSNYLEAFFKQIQTKYADDPGRAFDCFLSLMKLAFLDISLAMETYISMRERTIGAQQEAIRELSTPILSYRGKLIVPIVGHVDTARAMQLTEELLNAVRAHRVRVVILDVTGVPVVDSGVANHLIQTVQAVKLLGAAVILTGISPENAKTLARLSVDPRMLNTKGDLENGMNEANRLLGLQTISADGTPRADEYR